MPRIYNSTSEPIDFCKRCMPSERAARKQYGNVGDGPDGRGNCFSYGDDHPDYGSECDYTCEKCGKALTANDN